MSAPDLDPFTKAIRDYFASRIPSDLADKSVGLYFDPMPKTLPLEDLLGPDNMYSAARALEFFSTKIADKPAHISGGLHFSHDVSLSQLIRLQVLQGALFYRRIDLVDQINDKNEKTLESLRDDALKSMAQLAMMDGPALFTPSEPTPKNWCNPAVSSVWQRAEISFSSEPEGGAVAKAEGYKSELPKVAFPWRRFDDQKLEEVLKELKLGIKPKIGVPSPIDPAPDWLHEDLNASPITDLDIPKFNAQLMQKKFLAGHANIFSTTDLMSAKAGLKQFGATKGGGGQVMQGDEEGSIAPAVGGIKLEDFDELSKGSTSAEFMKTVALTTSENVSVSSAKDRIKVSFDYQFVEIGRPWLSWPLLTNTNWYLQDARRGELTLGVEGKGFGLLSAIATKVVVVRNLVIEAEFNESDRQSLAESFAIGPFRLDRSVDFQASSLRFDAMQFIAYLDSELPVLPPRSDPRFVA